MLKPSKNLLAAFMPNIKTQKIDSFKSFVNHFACMIPLLQNLPNATFFIKDAEAKYVLVNDNLAKRCQKPSHIILGKTAAQVFNSELGQAYTAQDFQVMKKVQGIFSQLELHSYQKGNIGWCLTTKIPLVLTAQSNGPPEKAVGLIGISIDLHAKKNNQLADKGLAVQLLPAIQLIETHYQNAIKIKDLAQLTPWSLSQFERHFKAAFQMTPKQYIQQKRFEVATQLLLSGQKVTEVALACGYTDHSAFSRKFKELTGMTPSQFRQLYR